MDVASSKASLLHWLVSKVWWYWAVFQTCRNVVSLICDGARGKLGEKNGVTIKRLFLGVWSPNIQLMYLHCFHVFPSLVPSFLVTLELCWVQPDLFEGLTDSCGSKFCHSWREGRRGKKRQAGRTVLIFPEWERLQCELNLNPHTAEYV